MGSNISHVEEDLEHPIKVKYFSDTNMVDVVIATSGIMMRFKGAPTITKSAEVMWGRTLNAVDPAYLRPTEEGAELWSKGGAVIAMEIETAEALAKALDNLFQKMSA